MPAKKAAAKAAPGVVAILTADDVKAAGFTDIPTGAPVKTADGSMQVKCAMPVLATDRVRFVGQPIAMVIADSARAAQDAAELVAIDYQDLASVTSMPAARRPGAAAA